jgi:hypothetical protein
MAIVQNPIIGRAKNKFAGAIFATQYGKNTLRSKPISVHNPKTTGQLMQRMRFNLFIALERLVLGFIRTGFKQVAVGMSSANVFVKENVMDAITGVYPSYAVDYTKLKVTMGTLTGADTPTVAAAATHKANFAWSDNSGEGDALASDKAMVLCINTTKNKAVWDTVTKTRTDAAYSYSLPAAWVGDSVACYLSFMNAAGAIIADSSYVNTIVVLA